MAEKGSVFQKGGGGTNFEQAIQTAFLTTLMIRGNAPCIPPNRIIEVAFQTTNRGYETDDLLVIAKSEIGHHRLLAQIKHNLYFSQKNNTFNSVMEAFWMDFNNIKIFDKEKDKLLIIKSGFTKGERNHLKSVLNWAKTHASEVDFIAEVSRIKAKQDQLNIFRTSLKGANKNAALTDKELWEFLKCLDVLEYDFLNEGSTDATYFLNLINLSKSRHTTANEKEIWNSIAAYVSKLNKDGGSVTVDSIQKGELYQYFEIEKLNPYFKAVEKLKSDSEVILKPLKCTIGNLHIERKGTYDSIVNSINTFQFTIVTGKPGVGKSAAVKDIIHQNYFRASVFVFRADQFNFPHLANVFSNQGISEALQDIFSCISLIPDKIIVIDSLEKLLEGDPENAFKQLLSLLKEFPDIKIVGTARRYSIDLIFQRFGIDQKGIGVVNIGPLSHKELTIVSKQFPQLKNILRNQKIKKLLECPKYLDFAITSLIKEKGDFSGISLKAFKEQLWNTLVKDSTNRIKGYPAKREDAFLYIAVNRAKEMKLFVKPVQVDEEAIVLLENDEIIFQEDQNRKYSPSHDILEDWALMKYVASLFQKHPNPKDLFDYLGNEPAIRRAFRLWIEDELIEDQSGVYDLIRLSLDNTDIERYWADEVLIAIFKSDNCNSFFQTFEKELLNNNARNLNRCIHLIRTACKEGHLKNKSFSLLLPIGSGWQAVITFIKKHLNKLNKIRLSICNLLFDWEYRLLFQPQKHQKEIYEVKEITIHFINQIETANEFWESENLERKTEQLISLLYNLSDISQSDISKLIERASKAKRERRHWKLNVFYENVIDKCLSGLGTIRLTKALPELVVQTAWREWKLKFPEKINENSVLSRIGGSRLRNEDCWGIKDDFSFSPSGIFKTPIYNLLKTHPLIGLQFITEFLNYSIEFYINANYDYKHDLIQIELKLNDNSEVKVWGSSELWIAYRGLSVTHNGIESLLMSLEKFLLEVAKNKTENSRKNLRFVFNYLLCNSNNVTITSVLTSVAIAYPEEAGDEILPLLSVKEFYNWDLTRALTETQSLAPQDPKIPFAQKERSKSNQLPHRRKYRNGLRDFVLDYQFNISTLNKQIHKIFDRLKMDLQPDDIMWKKVLTEIDSRNHKLGDYDEKLGGFPIQPKYDEDVSEFINSNQDYLKTQSIAIQDSTILGKAYEGKASINLKVWQEIFLNYSKNESLDFLYDRPITLALIGLRDFKKDLKENQENWCVETLIDSIVTILKNEFSQNYGLGRSYNLIEKEIALSSFHFLLDCSKDQEEKNNLVFLMIYLVFAPFNHHDIGKVMEYIRKIFFERYPNEAKRVWIGLIKYAQFRKLNPVIFDDRDQDRLQALKTKEEKFVFELSSTEDLTLKINEINLEKYEGYLLALAFVMTPFNTKDQIFPDYINHFILLLVKDLTLKENYSYNRSNKDRQIQHDGVLKAKQYLSDLILEAEDSLSFQVIDSLFDALIRPTTLKLTRDLNKFAAETFEYVVLKFYDYGTLKPEGPEKDLRTKKFWSLWEYLFLRVKESNKGLLLSTLFFNINFLLYNFNGEANEKPWLALKNENGLYFRMIADFGKFEISRYVIDFFSTVGEPFLPSGLSQLVLILKKNPTDIISLITPSAERLVRRLFYNHISSIKQNKNLINDFIWVLDRMVDLGSSQAYFFRENVITYKPDV